jgi:hypothetical protein
VRRALLLPAAALAAQLACVGADDHDAVDTDAARTADTDVYKPSETGDTARYDDLPIEIVDQPFRAAEGDAVVVTGKVDLGDIPASHVVLSVSSSIDGALPLSPTVDAKGRFTARIEGLSVGVHDVAFVATAEEEGRRGRVEARIGICEYPEAQTFDVDPLGQGWQRFGDAYWDPRGWMEITGNAQSRAGSIYFVERKVDPGDFRLEFRIATGNGINTGADGYAVNIVNVPTVGDLAAYVGTAGNGGCLGYGVVSGCSTPGMTVDAFHIEFDTWQNSNDPVDDPTSQTHIAITLDGNPSNHVLWTPYYLEDLQWRTVAVEAQGERIHLTVDGVTVIDREIPDFRFDGGWIGVSGSTGWATNEHRFDDLRILDRCVIPE